MHHRDIKYTIAKSPFTERNGMSIELWKQHIRDLKPNLNYHDFHTIKWLRKKCSENVIKKSIATLFPNNGKPVIDSKAEPHNQKRQRLQREWLDSHAQPKDNFKNVVINPKYFFNQKTFEKILKLKEIFLEFDEDGSRKMEINEIEEMFNINKIEASISELVNLFFKNRKGNKEDIHKLYLDFYQFMQFALKKDQDFRLFMRKIKMKVKTKQINNTSTSTISPNLNGHKHRYSNSNYSPFDENPDNDYHNFPIPIANKEEEDRYLPMSFNLVLDYFITKGKERNSKAIIEKGIKEIDKIILNKNSNKKFPLNSIHDIENIPVSEYESQLDKINFIKLIQEFSNLFRIKDEKDALLGGSEKKRGSINMSFSNAISVDRTRRNSKSNNALDFISNYNSHSNLDKDSEGESKIYSGILSRQLSKENITKLNQSNLNKYHSLKIALEETKKAIDTQKQQIKKYNNNSNSNSNINLSNNAILYYTGSLPQLFKQKTIGGRDKEIGTYFSKGSLIKKRLDYVPPFILREIELEKK